MTTILDPTDERVPVRRSLTKRPEAISGTVALLDISKPRGDVLLNQLEVRLRERLPEVDVLRYSKPTFTKPAPEALKQELAKEADFVVEGLAD
ncbi:MAG: hypothetical protein F4Y97_05035 [Dehalococcoidia bacterium]|nr:hypothetical protein [Dehalococcoidia bacterium]MXY72389.1 hypothetical protein [Dehalococcoidia bacterium]MYD28706.1 hypothetical protein [Dehalococcoidia bacterium]